MYFGKDRLKADNAADVIRRALGFNPLAISEIREQQRSEYEIRQKYSDQRSDIIKRIKNFERLGKSYNSAEWFEILNIIEDYNQSIELNKQPQSIAKPFTERDIQNMYFARGVLCGVSYAMHLATMPMYGDENRMRPAVVIGGGREPHTFTAYTNHVFLHTNGMLPCCKSGGCWKARTVPLGDGSPNDRSLCFHPVTDPLASDGQVIPYCMAMITPDEAALKIRQYLSYEKV